MMPIKQLIPVQEKIVGDYSIPTADARDLYMFLGVKKPFPTWLKTQIKRARLIENVDYIIYDQEVINSGRGRPSIECHITTDAAKSIAMLSATEKGDEVRAYFIQCERIALNQPAMPTVSDPALQAILHQSKQIEAMVIGIDQARKHAAAAEEKAIIAQGLAHEAIMAQQWMTIRQYVFVHQINRQLPPGTEQQQYGRWLTGYCKERGYPLYKEQSDQYSEWKYPVSVIQQTLYTWLARRNGQGPIQGLEIDDDGVWYDN
jgi:phage anti-repressor protein